MTRSCCCYYIILLLPISLFLLLTNCINAKIQQLASTENLSSNKYNNDKGHEIHNNLINQLFCEEYEKHVFDCYLPNKMDVIVKFILNDNGINSFWMKEVQLYCFNENLINISLPLINDFPKKADHVILNSCRFEESTDMKDILKNSLKLSDITMISFNNKNTDSSLSRASLGKLDSFIDSLSFDIKNISTLPPDLFFGVKKIRKLSISSLSVNLTQLHSLLAPLENLENLIINAIDLQDVHGRKFDHQKNLSSLSLHDINITSLPSDIFSSLTNLKNIAFNKTCFKSLPRNLFNRTRDIKEFRLIQKQEALKELPTEFLHNLTHLEIVMINCQLETIPADIFSGSKNIISIDLKRNNLSEIPLELFSDQKELLYLDLSENKIRTFDVRLLKYNLKLKHLNLSDNKIMRFPINIRLPNLVSLQLARNFSIDLNLYTNQDKLVNEILNSNCSYEIRLDDRVLILNCSNGNDIPSPYTFNLPGIELYMNNITLNQIQSSQVLLDNELIVAFSLLNSTITELPERFLSNLTRLKKVVLDLPLVNISHDTFFNSMRIENIKISGTLIEELPEFIFSNQTNLTDLDLSKNKLTEIANYAFKSNKYLRKLRLSHNYLKALSPLMFYNLLQLREIYLDNNHLCYMSPNAFAYTRRIKIMDMNHNQLGRTQPFSIAVKTLEKLMLSNNSIEDNYFRGIQQLSSSTITIDLSLNNITSLDQWDLSSIQFESNNLIFTHNSAWTIKVTNKQSFKTDWIVFGRTSLYCDCSIMSFKPESNQSSIFKSLQCLSLDKLRDHPVSGLPLDELLCPMNSTCPDECRCYIRPFNSTLIVNCSGPVSQLTEVPALPKIETAFQNGIELYIANNQLRSLQPDTQSGYEGVTKLVAANNRITDISIGDIPENIIFLDVSFNQLQELHQEVLTVLEESRTLKSISVYQNPWICNCLSKNLVQFVLNKTLNSSLDKCLDGKLFRELKYPSSCFFDESKASFNTVTEVISYGLASIILIFIFSLPALLPILYYRNKERILVWMFAHGICLCCATEEEVDKNKQYDAFVSYSSLDEEFVAKLVEKLESGPRPYKLCLHDRDWVVGGYIPNQIEESVDRSRRTIIVMSQNFLKSKWTRLEFRTAHNATIHDKRVRVIVILLEDITDIESLDFDLRKYIKMYTYLKCNDVWFWKKLTYAMPHLPKNNRKRKQTDLKSSPNADTTTNYSFDRDILF